MDLWVVLGVIFAGLGLVTPFLANIRRPLRKRLEYVITRNQGLLNVPRGVSVEITVEGRTVEQAYVTVLRFANSGTEDFPARDWESPLAVRLEGSSVLSAEQIAARPAGWRVDAPVIRGDLVEIAPFLFNAGDLFELQIISDGATPDPKVTARILGVRQISRRPPVYNLGNGVDGALDASNKIVYSAFALIWIALIALVSFGPMVTTSGDPLPFTGRLPLIAFAVGIFGLYFAFLRWATVRNRRWRPAERF